MIQQTAITVFPLDVLVCANEVGIYGDLAEFTTLIADSYGGEIPNQLSLLLH